MEKPGDLIDLEKLICFTQLAEFGSFARASAILRKPQRVLSRNVRQLEDHLGIELLVRLENGIALTEGGQKLLARSKDILQNVSGVIHEIDEITRHPRQLTVLGIPPMVSRILCVSIARRYLEALPASSLKIVESFSGYIRESLSTGEFDVAISYMSDLIGETLWIEEFFLVGRRELAGRAASECPLGDLGKYPLILPGRPHGLRLLLDDCALRYRLKLQIILETDSLPTIIDLVSQGVGFAVLPVAAIYDLMAERQLSALRIIKPGLSRSVVMATSTQKPVSQSARALLDIIRDEARKFRSKSGLSTSVIAGL